MSLVHRAGWRLLRRPTHSLAWRMFSSGRSRPPTAQNTELDAFLREHNKKRSSARDKIWKGREDRLRKISEAGHERQDIGVSKVLPGASPRVESQSYNLMVSGAFVLSLLVCGYSIYTKDRTLRNAKLCEQEAIKYLQSYADEIGVLRSAFHQISLLNLPLSSGLSSAYPPAVATQLVSVITASASEVTNDLHRGTAGPQVDQQERTPAQQACMDQLQQCSIFFDSFAPDQLYAGAVSAEDVQSQDNTPDESVSSQHGAGQPRSLSVAEMIGGTAQPTTTHPHTPKADAQSSNVGYKAALRPGRKVSLSHTVEVPQGIFDRLRGARDMTEGDDEDSALQGGGANSSR